MGQGSCGGGGGLSCLSFLCSLFIGHQADQKQTADIGLRLSDIIIVKRLEKCRQHIVSFLLL